MLVVVNGESGDTIEAATFMRSICIVLLGKTSAHSWVTLCL